MAQKIVAVTGSEGYIGSALVMALNATAPSTKIRGIDKAMSPQKDADRYRELHTLDMAQASPATLSQSLEDVECVFHLAAARTDWGLDYIGYERDNLIATQNLVEAARIAGVRHWVHFSTVGVYGPAAEPIDETAPFQPDTDYGRTKARADEELLRLAKSENWALRVIRPSAVFSEHQPANTNLFRLIEAIRRRRFLLIGDGSQTKTTSYLHNVVDAALWLYDSLPTGGIRVYNYVDEPKLTTVDMVTKIRRQMGRKGIIPHIPLNLVEPPARILDWIGNAIGRDLPITAARIRKFSTSTNFDSSQIRNDGFVPRFSSEEALWRTVQWHIDSAQKRCFHTLRT